MGFGRIRYRPTCEKVTVGVTHAVTNMYNPSLVSHTKHTQMHLLEFKTKLEVLCGRSERDISDGKMCLVFKEMFITNEVLLKIQQIQSLNYNQFH